VTILQSKPFVENAQALSWVDSALEGDQKALENLSKSLRPLIFNLCQKFFLSPEDAEDNTQEILIRVITKLGLYDRQKGQLITWVLRIAKNHLLDFRRTKGRMEAQVSSFDQYFSALEQVTDAALGDPHHVGPEDRLLAMEANASCLLGMLLCLEQKQRLVIILGDEPGLLTNGRSEKEQIFSSEGFSRGRGAEHSSNRRMLNSSKKVSTDDER
jgi:RNA polymerase sigma factor (sigma-70 family)